MSLPEFLRKKVERLLFDFCRQAADDSARPRHLRYRIEGQQVSLYEVRRFANDPGQHQSLEVAQLRFIPELNQWTLHHFSEGKWLLHLGTPPSLDIAKILKAVKLDPVGEFWPE